MKQSEVVILANRPVAESWRELELEWDPAAGRPAPGQFFTFRATASTDPLLRRPLAFSAADAEGTRVWAIYQVRGQATRLLAELASGSRLDVIGPLGRPFPKPDSGERPLLAAGGIGLGPVLFLARDLAPVNRSGAAKLTGSNVADPASSASGGAPTEAESGGPYRRRETQTEPIVVLGFRTAAAVPLLELPDGAVVCTDDGTRGFRGTVADWIERDAREPNARLYACGPAPMLASLAAIARRRRWNASFSAEQWMACGVGACMGCALPRADGSGYLRVCADGPVFDSPARDGAAKGGEIDWVAAARL